MLQGCPGTAFDGTEWQPCLIGYFLLRVSHKILQVNDLPEVWFQVCDGAFQPDMVQALHFRGLAFYRYGGFDGLDHLFLGKMPGAHKIQCNTPGNDQQPGVQPAFGRFIAVDIAPYFDEYILKQVFRVAF